MYMDSETKSVIVHAFSQLIIKLSEKMKTKSSCSKSEIKVDYHFSFMLHFVCRNRLISDGTDDLKHTSYGLNSAIVLRRENDCRQEQYTRPRRFLWHIL